MVGQIYGYSRRYGTVPTLRNKPTWITFDMYRLGIDPVPIFYKEVKCHKQRLFLNMDQTRWVVRI
jgi:hypothetical protein